MPHNFIGLNNKMDNFRKGIFTDPFDEPTFLTFALDFKFDDSITADMIDEVSLERSPLFSTGKNSAAEFLVNRGYSPQANALSTFTSMFKYLTNDAPWYFQSISGLSSIYEDSTKMNIPFRNGVITVNTLEAVDLRMQEIASIYRNAILDLKYKRERVPDNLRWFSVDIYIAEFRNLRYRLPGSAQDVAKVAGINTADLGAIVGGGNILTNVMDQFGYTKFKCRQCEFDFSKSTSFTAEVNVGGSNIKAASNSFDIKVGWVEEEAKFADGTRLYDDAIKTAIKNPWGNRYIGTKIQNAANFLTGLPVIGDDIEEAGQKAMDAISQIGGFINPALKTAVDFIHPPIISLGESQPYGYETNDDIVPKRDTSLM